MTDVEYNGVNVEREYTVIIVGDDNVKIARRGCPKLFLMVFFCGCYS